MNTIVILLLIISSVYTFTISDQRCHKFRTLEQKFSPLLDNVEPETNRVSSLMKFIGPYPAISLRFPSLSTSSQRKRNITGIALDFILDTAANTNTINIEVARELNLTIVGDALPGYGAAGSISGGQTYMLGNCTIDRVNADVFMTNLTASALPVASPGAAGLLSVAFLNCFHAVKFEWGGGIDGKSPMVTFYGDKDDANEESKKMNRVTINVLDGILLPSVTILINQVPVTALIDTCSPVTVVNAATANAAGLTTFRDSISINNAAGSKGFNPFKQFLGKQQAVKAMNDAVSSGKILIVASPGAKQIELAKTKMKPTIKMGSGDVLISSDVYVGDLPGLAALDGMGFNSSPAAILGMDIIKKFPCMLYRQDSVYI